MSWNNKEPFPVGKEDPNSRAGKSRPSGFHGDSLDSCGKSTPKENGGVRHPDGYGIDITGKSDPGR